MLSSILKSARLLAVATGLTAVSLSFATMASAQITAQVVMSGLNNPRGIAIGADGGVYVTEAGTGGGPTAPFVDALSGEREYYGATGSVSRLLGGVQSRVVSNLPSIATATGGSASGLQDIVFTSNGTAYGVIGSPGGPAQRTALNVSANGAGATSGPGDQFGRLVRLDFTGGGSATYLADFVAAEGNLNPDSVNPINDVNSNPYALTPLVGGGFMVVDAGANALWNVNSNLTTITAASVFPNKQNNLGVGPPFAQAVPTSIAVSPSGAMLVSQLTGFPFKQGGADIYSVPAGGGTPTVAYSGFTTIIDLVFGPDGNLYVLQLTQNGLGPEATTGPGPGQLIRVDPLTGQKTVLNVSLPDAPGGLLFSTGMAFGNDGSLYVSNLGTASGTGQVLRITGVTVPEPGTGLLALAAVLPVAAIVIRRRKK